MFTIKNTFARAVVVFVCLAFSAMLFACQSPKQRRAPKMSVTTPAATIEQTGDAREPGKVDTVSGSLSVPLPAKSTVNVVAASPTTPGRIEIVVSEPTVLSGRMDTISTVAPAAFVPDAPPTQNELARAAGLKWSLVAGGLFLVAALALVYFQHYKAAGFAAVGAFVVPLAGNFFSNEKAMLVCGVITAVVCTLVAAWYIIDGKLDGKLSVNKPLPFVKNEPAN